MDCLQTGFNGYGKTLLFINHRESKIIISTCNHLYLLDLCWNQFSFAGQRYCEFSLRFERNTKLKNTLISNQCKNKKFGKSILLQIALK